MALEQLVIGIDLGGTKIHTALVDGSGRIVLHDHRETQASEGRQAVLNRMLAASRRIKAQAEAAGTPVAAVGIGSPGPLDVTQGVVLNPPNLPGWNGVPLKRLIEEGLGLPAFLENDANAAALGEHRFGAGRGVAHMIYVTAGTGIGGGLILDGKLYHGAAGMAGEIGHMTILPNGPLCGCGNRGCLEAMASGRAIAQRAQERLTRAVPARMAALVAGDPQRITAELVTEAAKQGDDEAQEILSEALSYLGIGMANLVNLFNPQLIVIGGGLTNLGETLFDTVRRAIDRHALAGPAQAVRVMPAELADNVGVLGAAALALMQAGESP